jgi:hypothetical protein
MCARRTAVLATAMGLIFTLTGCAAPARTGSSFCAQLGRELPAIGQPMGTGTDVTAMVDRYERLLKRAPLSIEGDFAILTGLLQDASKVNPSDKEALQDIADATYAANQSALNVRDWVKSTCAVDISTGLNIDPPRLPTTTTLATATTVASTTTVATTTSTVVP